jgi:hypothetical protein
VWHNTENRRREAHLELAKSLRDELFQARELIFIDDLLCDAVEEVGHACDDHLHVLWTDSPDHNWKEHHEHDVAIIGETKQRDDSLIGYKADPFQP